MLKNIIFLSLCIFIGCSDNNITNPEPEPGRRDYTWTVDTINIVYPVHKIWGSDPTNVWAINESDYNHSIWHYDGNNWSTDGSFRFILPHALWGFSENNVLIGGQPFGQIWNFTGDNWDKFAEIKKDGIESIAFENIWGYSANDFYAVGAYPDDQGYYNNSIITHFKKDKWTLLNTDDLIGIVVHLYTNKSDDKTYFSLIKIGGSEHADSTLLYEYTPKKNIKLYNSLEIKGKQADISLIDGKVYFILGSEIAEREGDQFQILFKIDNPNFYHCIWGRTSKDIFLLMTDGLAHYNGEDIEYLFHFNYSNAKPWTQIYGATIFKEDVFFTIYEPPTDLKLIYHGKLKNGG